MGRRWISCAPRSVGRGRGGRKRDVVWEGALGRRRRRRRRRSRIHIGISSAAAAAVSVRPAVVIASHNRLHSKQPISPPIFFELTAIKASLPPSLPPPPSALSPLPVRLLLTAFPACACAYQARALGAILQTRHLKLAMLRSPLSLSFSLWGHHCP